jgi:glucose uptake protein
MLLVNTYTQAVLLSIITMLCWGSWPNTQKLTSKSWRFELFYWDYVWGIILMSLLFAFIPGSWGNKGNNFWQDLMQADWINIISSFIGGIIFNLANILFVAALTIGGMLVTFTIAIGVGLVIGILINYLAVPIGNEYYLFGGVVLIVLAIFFSAIAHKRLSKQAERRSAKGIVFPLAAGVLFGFYYLLIARSMSVDFQIPKAGKLGPYTAVFCFSIGVLISTFVFNTILMKKPVQGIPLHSRDYFKGSKRDHLLGMLGGAIWCIGFMLSILSAGKAGFTISFGLGQGNAMIAAIWGIVAWKEFRGAPSGTSKFLVFMFVCYILGLILIVLSRNV